MTKNKNKDKQTNAMHLQHAMQTNTCRLQIQNADIYLYTASIFKPDAHKTAHDCTGCKSKIRLRTKGWHITQLWASSIELLYDACGLTQFLQAGQ